MKPGIYSAEFSSNLGGLGSGLIVVDQDHIHGGDTSYLYAGNYRETVNKVQIALDVKHYRGPRNSVMGSLDAFQLELHGTPDPNGATLSGHVVGNPQARISIRVNRLWDLRQ